MSDYLDFAAPQGLRVRGTRSSQATGQALPAVPVGGQHAGGQRAQDAEMVSA